MNLDRKPWFSADEIEGMESVALGWDRILSELQTVLASDLWLDWPREEGIYDGRWDVFGLSVYGTIPKMAAHCPRTLELLRGVPGLGLAGFSRLAPGTEITPHVGYSEAVIRCHLGLVVPADCGLKVDGEVRHWKAGEWLCFDDTFEHSAWNRSHSDRIVLLVDVMRDPATARAAADTLPEWMERLAKL